MPDEPESMFDAVVLDVTGATVGTVSGLLLSPRTQEGRWLADRQQRLLPWSSDHPLQRPAAGRALQRRAGRRRTRRRRHRRQHVCRAAAVQLLRAACEH